MKGLEPRVGAWILVCFSYLSLEFRDTLMASGPEIASKKHHLVSTPPAGIYATYDLGVTVQHS